MSTEQNSCADCGTPYAFHRCPSCAAFHYNLSASYARGLYVARQVDEAYALAIEMRDAVNNDAQLRLAAEIIGCSILCTVLGIDQRWPLPWSRQ